MPTRPIVPPGGFAGWNQQTPATQALLSRPKKKRRRKVAAKKRPTRRRSTRTTTRRKPARASTRRKKTGRLKKGSPEAKRRMAQLRRMQKRKR